MYTLSVLYVYKSNIIFLPFFICCATSTGEHWILICFAKSLFVWINCACLASSLSTDTNSTGCITFKDDWNDCDDEDVYCTQEISGDPKES